jgi:hypothetical protein
MRILAAVLLAAVALAAFGQESKVRLKDAPGREKVNACLACHSADYITMNSRYMDKAAWTASVNKMINAFGAPIDKGDVDAIATYLAQNYGVSN